MLLLPKSMVHGYEQDSICVSSMLTWLQVKRAKTVTAMQTWGWSTAKKRSGFAAGSGFSKLIIA